MLCEDALKEARTEMRKLLQDHLQFLVTNCSFKPPEVCSS